MSKYFVTGATGFIGGEITKQLIGRGHAVVALVRSPEKAGMLKALGVEIHAGDITVRESLRAPMTGVDGVFHVAAWYKVGVAEPLADQINVDGTRNVLKTMRTLEIPRGVYTSTVAVFSDTHGVVPDETFRYDGTHLSTYDRTKWIAHYRVAQPKIDEGLPLTIVMPGLVYGPGDASGMHTALVDLLRGRLPMTPARTAFCWAHVEDTARAHILAMEKGRPGETYIIAGPRHTFEEAFGLAARLAKVRPPFFHPGPHTMRALAFLMKGAGRIANLPPALRPETLRVMAGTTYFGSPDKAARELGFAARPLEEGFAQTLEHELRALGRA
ncbi:MAG: epimerase [Acidobacteria bacterium RIFCSPLOWO2_12_FULL_67_14b]|nr:MAG: epimerase [Acidobacteria bacterium RIFCSPLOWO2_12_FULL_67_14b]